MNRLPCVTIPALREAYIFSNKNDNTLLYALKKPGSIDLLSKANDEHIETEFKMITEMAARERGEEPLLVDTRLSTVDDEEPVEFLLALHSTSLTRNHMETLCTEHEDVIKDHQEKASKLVAQLIRLIDGSLPDKDVLQQLRQSHVGQFNTATLETGSLMIIYDVKVSAEDAKRPMLRKPSLRKSHLDRIMQLALTSRTPDGVDELTTIPQNEVILITDAGRDGNATALLSSVKINDQAPFCPFADFTGYTHTCSG
jgi:hypothetical protein